MLNRCIYRYVDPASRGLGIGKKLLAQAKVLAEETNATGEPSVLCRAKEEGLYLAETQDAFLTDLEIPLDCLCRFTIGDPGEYDVAADASVCHQMHSR